MQLGEAEVVGLVDQDGVGAADVEAVLDDGGADQHVEVAAHERAHRLLDLGLGHLAVADGDAGARAQLADAQRQRLQLADAVVQHEHLPLARELARDRVLQHAVVAEQHARLDLLTAGRRVVERADAADAEQRAVQRARDRRRRQRQHVDLGAQLLEPLLLPHAEALLLVDDDQREVVEGDAFAQQLVRADDDVDAALQQLVLDRAPVGAGAVARQHLDRQAERLAAARERARVLLGEDRRRAQHGDLPAAERHAERRAQRDLRLAEADVAAQQPVHRRLLGEVGLDLAPRARLVGGVAEGERVEEVAFERVLRVRRALDQRALALHLQQFGGEVEQGLLHLFLALLEALAAELVERRLAAAADVLLDEVDLARRHEQLDLVLEAQPQVLLDALAARHQLGALEARDAVHRVHDEVAGAELEEALDGAARDHLPLPHARLLRHAGELDVAQRRRLQVRDAEAAADRARQQLDLLGGEVDALVREDLLQPLALVVAAAEQQHAALHAADAAQAAGGIGLAGAHGAARRQDLVVEVVARQRTGVDARARPQRVLQFLHRRAQVRRERGEPRDALLDAQRFVGDDQRARRRDVAQHGAFLVGVLAAERERVAFVHRQRPLRTRVERADRLQRAVEELQAHGLLGRHREQVDDVAAHAALAGGEHQRHLPQAGGLRLLQHLRAVDGLAGVQFELRARERLRRRDRLQQRLDAAQQRRLVGGVPLQRLLPRAARRRIGLAVVAGLLARQHVRRHAEGREVGLQLQAVDVVGGQHQHRALVALPQDRHQQARRRAPQPADLALAAERHLLAQCARHRQAGEGVDEALGGGGRHVAGRRG